MNRLFVRTYLGVLAAAVVGTAACFLIARGPYEMDLLDSHRFYVEVVHPRLVSDLEESPEEEWAAIASWWGDLTEYEIDIQPRSNPLWAAVEGFESPIEQARFAVFTGLRTDEFWAAYPISGSDLIVYYYFHDPWSLRYMLASILGYLIIFSSLAGATYLMLRPVIRSTHELTSTAQAYAEGRLDARVQVIKGAGPLAGLSNQFNRMAEEIQHKIHEQEIMTTAISHELKTPLTRLRLALDMALASADEAKRTDMLITMDKGIDDLDKLTAELLTLARLTYSNEPLELERVALGEILEQLAAKLESVEPSVKLTLGASVRGECLGHHDHLSHAFSNLLSNGKRYADSTVHVELMESDHDVVVWIDDDGPGIPSESREEVFVPFARLDLSRNRTTGGYGLGLAIAKQSLRVQGGSVHIEESPMGGARFVVRLSKATGPGH